MNILDHISDSLKTIVWVKRLNSSMRIRESFDSGSGMGKIRIRDKHPESATLKKAAELLNPCTFRAHHNVKKELVQYFNNCNDI